MLNFGKFRLVAPRVLQIVLIAVIFYGFAIRTVRFANSSLATDFLSDYGRDILVAKHLPASLNKFIAPASSFSLIPNTPFYFWLIAVGYSATNSFWGVNGIFFLLGVLSIGLAFLVGKEFNFTSGLFFAALVSVNNQLVGAASFFWQPNSIPFFTLLWLLLLIKNHKSRTTFTLIAQVVVTFLAIFMHSSALMLIPMTWFSWQNWQQKKHFSQKEIALLLLTCIGMLLLWRLLSLLSSPENSVSANYSLILESLVPSTQQFQMVSDSLLLALSRVWRTSLLVLICTTSIILLVNWRRFQNFQYFFILKTIIVGTILYYFFPLPELFQHYLLVIFPLWLFALILVFQFSRTRFIVGLYLMYSIFMNSLLLQKFFYFNHQPFSTPKIVEFIWSHSVSHRKNISKILVPDRYCLSHQPVGVNQHCLSEWNSALIWFYLEEISQRDLVILERFGPNFIPKKRDANGIIYSVCPVDLATYCESLNDVNQKTNVVYESPDYVVFASQ